MPTRLPILMLFALSLALTACDPAEPPTEPLAGSWIKQGSDDGQRQLLILDEQGDLHLIGFAGLQGNRWHRQGEQLGLTLTTRSEALTLLKSSDFQLEDDARLTLGGEHRLSGDYQRDSQTGLLDIEIQLPADQRAEPGSVLAMTLEDDQGEQLQHHLSVVTEETNQLHFRFFHDARKLDEERLYQLQARIIVDGSSLFTGNAAIAADDAQNLEVILPLNPVGAAASLADRPARWQHDRHWQLTTLGKDTPVGDSNASLVFSDNSTGVSGQLGCNRFRGEYRLDGDQLSFHGIAATLMACKSGMETEQAFSTALRNTSHWRLGEGRLELLDGDKLLATLEATD